MSDPSPTTRACRQCGAELAPALLVCPACGALTRADELKQLAEEAGRTTSPTAALIAWRAALALLPPETRQHQQVMEKIEALAKAVDTGAAARAPARAEGGAARKTGVAGAVAALLAVLAKSKFALLFLLTKGKILLLGLTKMSTLFSMLLSFGVYWTVWGWKFAAGLVVSIYIHEMGHVAALRRFGIPASAPMFIPGLGAVVRMRAQLATAREDARVGLAGPIWGLGAAMLAWALAFALHAPFFAAIGQVGAWINLFNLTPVWQLDGSRGWRALTQRQRWVALGAVIAALVLSAGEAKGVLALIALFGAIRTFEKQAAPEPDPRALAEYVGLIASLTALASLPVPR